jgi:hypothetical protein
MEEGREGEKKKSPNKAQRFDVSIAHKNLSKKERVNNESANHKA